MVNTNKILTNVLYTLGGKTRILGAPDKLGDMMKCVHSAPMQWI